MRFTKKSDYALRLMETLARTEGEQPLSVKAVCRGSDLAVKFMQSIVRDLVKAGLVYTKSGPSGGVMLTRDPEKINVLEIIEAVEGKIRLMDCLEHPEVCGDSSTCSIMTVLHSAQEAMLDRLKSWNLKIMVAAKKDPFFRVPAGHYQYPKVHCPVIR